jgi:hypothetical protein
VAFPSRHPLSLATSIISQKMDTFSKNSDQPGHVFRFPRAALRAVHSDSRQFYSLLPISRFHGKMEQSSRESERSVDSTFIEASGTGADALGMATHTGVIEPGIREEASSRISSSRNQEWSMMCEVVDGRNRRKGVRIEKVKGF